MVARFDPDASDKPVTKKPAETRMGKGKGAPEYWVAVVKPDEFSMKLKVSTNERPATRCGWRPKASLSKQKFVTRADQEVRRALTMKRREELDKYVIWAKTNFAPRLPV